MSCCFLFVDLNSDRYLCVFTDLFANRRRAKLSEAFQLDRPKLLLRSIIQNARMPFTRWDQFIVASGAPRQPRPTLLSKTNCSAPHIKAAWRSQEIMASKRLHFVSSRLAFFVENIHSPRLFPVPLRASYPVCMLGWMRSLSLLTRRRNRRPYERE